MVYANLFSLIFLPTIIACYYYSNQVRIKNGIFRNFVYFVIGIVIGFLSLGLIPLFLTGHFLVPLIQMQVAQVFFLDRNLWIFAFGKEISTATWLIFPLITAIGAICYVLKTGIKTLLVKNGFILFFILNYLWLVFMYIGFQIKGDFVLQYSYYACYLIPPMFLALAAMCSDCLESIKSTRFGILLFSEICVSLLPFTIFSEPFRPFMQSQNFWIFFLLSSLSWMAVFMFSGIKPVARSHILWVIVIFIACLSLVSLSGMFISSGNYPVTPGEKFPDTYENGFVAIIDSTKLIHTETQGRKIRLWYNVDEMNDGSNYGAIFRNINCMYLWQYTWLSREDLPHMVKQDVDTLAKEHPPPEIVILSAKSYAFPAAKNNLNSLGYNATLLSEKPMDRGNIHFNITIIQIRPL
jgi:hypothetical protein